LTRPVRAVEDGLRAVPRMDCLGIVGPGDRGARQGRSQGGPVGGRDVLRGWNQRSRPSRRGRSPQKTRIGEPADHALGRSKGGFGTKAHLSCDRRGRFLGACLTPGQASECKLFIPLMEKVCGVETDGTLTRKPDAAAGDKGYCSKENRKWLQEHGIKDV